MGFPLPFLRGALAVVATAALTGSGLVAAQSAVADPANPTPVSATALPTAQVNGVVWTQVVSNGIDYVGGSFSQSQPAGAAAGVGVTNRSNLFAYDVATGVAIPGFGAIANAQVRGMAASPDGSRIYIVGDFTTVNGVARNHIAALQASTGALVTDFAPSLNGSALAVAATSSRVYVGGAFTAAAGVTRSRAAAFSTSGALLSWAPQADGGPVRAIALAPDSSKALMAGGFTSTNGQTQPGRGMVAVDTSTGASLPWATSALIHNGGVVNQPDAVSTASSSIYSLSTRGGTVYATGQATSTTWQDANLEGTVAMRWSDGGLVWLEDCHGDTYSSVAFDDAVYVASHSHNCSTLGGFEEMNPQAHRALGFTQAATQTLQHNLTQGPGSYQDFFGQPAPSLLDWYPTLSIGTYTGSSQAAWSVAQGSGYLVYGGEFPKVNGTRQTGLVRFQGYNDPANGASDPIATPTPTPTPTPTDAGSSSDTKPNRVSTPSTVALGPTAVAVKWRAPKASTTDKVSGYVIKAYKGSKVLKTVDVGKTKRVATIPGLKKSTTYKIGVAAKNSHGTGKFSPLHSVKTKAKGKNVSATKHPSKVKQPSATKGSGRLRVKWAAASTSGALAVSSYQVRVVLHGKTVKTYTVSSAVRSKLVTSLKKRTAYSVSVRAASWAGWGSWSTARSARTK
jgi:hypothetical protein